MDQQLIAAWLIILAQGTNQAKPQEPTRPPTTPSTTNISLYHDLLHTCLLLLRQGAPPPHANGVHGVCEEASSRRLSSLLVQRRGRCRTSSRALRVLSSCSRRLGAPSSPTKHKQVGEACEGYKKSGQAMSQHAFKAFSTSALARRRRVCRRASMLERAPLFRSQTQETRRAKRHRNATAHE